MDALRTLADQHRKDHGLRTVGLSPLSIHKHRFGRLLAAIFLLGLGIHTAQAQTELTLFAPVTGTLNSGAEDRWTFQAADGAMLSFRLQTTNGDLDPIMTLTGSAGNVILSNDDYDYPDTSDALLEGITIPRTDNYTLTVTGFGDTSGSYELTMLAGFAEIARQESFEDDSRWQTDHDTLEIVVGSSRLALLLTGASERGIVTYDNDLWDDHYVTIDIPEVNTRGNWQIGLIVRYQDAENYYLYNLNSQGQWRFIIHTAEGERPIRDWSAHPAIVAGQTQFSLGLLANGMGFDFFYNGQLIGRVADQTITGPGRVALMIETPADIGSELVAQFQNLVITTPLDAAVPQTLLTGNASVMVQELQRRRLVPSAGEMGLVVPESFVTYNRPGVNELPLGGSSTYRTFALGTTVTWEIAPQNLPAGCGLILRSGEASSYFLAYLDQNGGYGLSRRIGDHFEPGLYGEGPTPGSGPHRLLVIANESQLLYYINGQLVGTLNSTATDGVIGNAVVNFEATTTSCQFSDTWVWTWE